MISLFVPLLLTVTTSHVLSFPAYSNVMKMNMLSNLNHSKLRDRSGITLWIRTLRSLKRVFIHSTHKSWWTTIADSPQCVQDAATVFDEFTKAIFKEKHPLHASTVKFFGKDDAHCYQSALLILDEVRMAGGEKVPPETIEFYKAKKKDDIAERCNGRRQVALSNLATFEPPKNLEDGTVLVYSLITSINGPDCCETTHPLPLMHGQFEVVLGDNTETAGADADKPYVGKEGKFLRVKASEHEDISNEIVSPVRRNLCR